MALPSLLLSAISVIVVILVTVIFSNPGYHNLLTLHVSHLQTNNRCNEYYNSVMQTATQQMIVIHVHRSMRSKYSSNSDMVGMHLSQSVVVRTIGRISVLVHSHHDDMLSSS